PVNIEEQGIDDVKVFPNPTSDILNITSSETISEIEIVNVMGQVVKRMEVNADNAVCDVEDLKAGVYVVRIRTLRQAQGAALRKFVKE
ncbi:MAG: T9SS type A sorting domain-containing protein, partial [Bacteroidales bacterium]|nr:T9SS type A sorting domain-containing protein [Bacteroidales bacterium]